MLQMLRGKKSSLLVKIVLVIIVIGFSFFGIEGYFVASSNNSVADVGGAKISQEQFRERFGQYRQRMLQAMGQAADASYFEKPEVKRQVVDQLVNEQILLGANDKLGIAVPPEKIRDTIAAIPAFQNDGKFDPAQYRMALESQGMTPAGFEQRVRDDVGLRELPTQIATTALVTNAEIDAYLRLKDQRRDFDFAKIPKPAPKDTDVGDADVDAYYKTHMAQFMIPERVALEYIEIDASKLGVDDKPDDAALKALYEKEKARFVSNEQRLASHILVKVGGKGGPDEQKAALAKADAIETSLKDGGNFADIAKQKSDDLGSKNQGGDLGWLDKGSTDEAFDAALFTMKKGEISAPILSSEGYHIIDLRDVRAGKTRSFDDVKTDLAAEFTKSERERHYADVAGKLTDLTYQDPSSLEPAAKALGLTVQKTSLFPRSGGEGVAANPAVVKAAFSDSVLVQNNNSDGIELGPNHIAVVRVAEHKPATPMPLDTVKDKVRAKILADRSAAEAKTEADALFADLGKGQALAQVIAAKNLKVESEKSIGRDAANIDGSLIKAVFSMPRPIEGKPSNRLVALPNDEYALVALTSVTDGDPSKLDAKTRDATRNTLAQQFGGAAAREFVDALRKDTKVRIFADKLAE